MIVPQTWIIPEAMVSYDVQYKNGIWLWKISFRLVTLSPLYGGPQYGKR